MVASPPGIPPRAAALRARLARTIARLDRRMKALNALSLRYSWGRLGVVVVGVAFAFFSFLHDRDATAWIAAAATAALFSVIVFFHNRLLASIRRHRLFQQVKQSHVARMTRQWEDLPPATFSEVDGSHPFAPDLNLVGSRSVHRLLDTSISKQGSARLRDWLLEPMPDAARSRRRQEAVRALLPLTLFRDRVSLLGALATHDPDLRWDGEVLIKWLDAHPEHRRVGFVLAILLVLAALNAVLILLHTLGVIAPWWMLSLLAYGGFYMWHFRLYLDLFDQAEHLYTELNRFRDVLQYLERFRFGKKDVLVRLCAPFQQADPRPSRILRKAMWLAAATSTQRSEVIHFVLNVLMPWDLLFVRLLDRYKRRLRHQLPAWLDAWHELEALSSLATFAYLHPHYAFPEIHETADEGLLLDARQIGHPLLDEATRVRNDFRIEGLGEITLITGSNMSGKSTFLRTIGVNLSLAYAGGPVDAEMLSLMPLRRYTCINVSDSVSDGISYFYAEVRRLKALLTELRTGGATPLLYLVDEIFRGTNNRERLIGSRAFLRAVARERGVGIVSTHDLELVQLEGEVPGIRNCHFREDIAGGRMVFDYRLRPGPCPTTNALKIMQMEGLPVDPAGTTDA